MFNTEKSMLNMGAAHWYRPKLPFLLLLVFLAGFINFGKFLSETK